MSKTPLTDAAAVWMESEDDEIGRQYGLVGNVEIVKADFARSLEQRNAELEKALKNLVKWCDAHDWGCVPKKIESAARLALAKTKE
jgi:hypothetical protein